MSEGDKKSTIITIFMLIMVCILFFGLGYGYAAKKQVMDCNSYIEQEIMPYCPLLNGKITQTNTIQGGENYGKTNFSTFNFT